MNQAFPPGHFYSPIVNQDEIENDAIWSREVNCSGIDFGDEQHKTLLDEMITDKAVYPYHAPRDESWQFVENNGVFEWMDSKVLFHFLRAQMPKRIIEVGSGYSTSIMADIKNHYQPDMHITCIEPYPTPFLMQLKHVDSLLPARLQTLDLSLFDSLQSGDLLFVDSSHVVKTGSDVCRILFDILPRLPSGVFIHFHDIFLPYEYPKIWIQQGFNWNEQYTIKALLLGSKMFDIHFSCAYARYKFADLVDVLLNNYKHEGGSLYLRKL